MFSLHIFSQDLRELSSLLICHPHDDHALNALTSDLDKRSTKGKAMTSLFWSRGLAQAQAPSTPTPPPTGDSSSAPAEAPSATTMMGLRGLEPLEDYKDWYYGPEGPGRNCRHRRLVLGIGAPGQEEDESPDKDRLLSSTPDRGRRDQDVSAESKEVVG